MVGEKWLLPLEMKYAPNVVPGVITIMYAVGFLLSFLPYNWRPGLAGASKSIALKCEAEVWTNCEHNAETEEEESSASGVSCAICAAGVPQGDAARCIECKKTAHRYCAGVPLEEFESKGGSYTCLSCLKKLHEAKMADMKDYIVSLKAEIVELRVALDQVKSVEPTAAQWGSGSNNSEARSTAASHSCQRKGKKRTTTEGVLKNTIKLICKVDCNLEVKRKYRLSGAHRASSENSPTPHVAEWWFVISGDESALDQLALSWSAVKLQPTGL